MSFYGLRLEYALEDTSNFIDWKDKMEVALEENGVLEYTQTDIPKLVASEAQQLAQWKKDTMKSRREPKTMWVFICMEKRIHFQCGKISHIYS